VLTGIISVHGICAQETVVTPGDSIIIATDTVNNSVPDSNLIAVDTLGEDSIMVTQNKRSESSVDAPIDYTSKDSILFNMEEQKVYLYGEGEVYYKDIELKAEYIEIDLDKDLVFASGVADSTGTEKGRPKFKESSDEFEADSMMYNFRTKKGVIKGVFTEQPEGYLHSDRAKKQNDGEVCLKGGKFTTCDNKRHPHFYIRLTKAKVIPDDKIVSGPAYLVIEDVPIPIIAIPFGFFPNTTRNKSGVLIPEYGEETRRGFFLRNGGYYLNLGQYMDMSVKGDIYSKGSWAAKVNSRYKKRYKFGGTFNIDYTANRTSDPDLPDYSETNDIWIKWTHNQDPKARPNSKFSANVNMGSSSYHENSTYTNPQQLLQNQTQSSIAYTKRWPNTPFTLNASVMHSQNSKDTIKTITLNTPKVTFNMSRSSITDLWRLFVRNRRSVAKIRWYDNIKLAYTANMENKITTDESELFDRSSLDKFKNGIKHTIPVSTNIKALKFINITPSFNYTERWYLRSVRKYWDSDYYINDSTYGSLVTDTIDGFKRAYDYSLSTSFSTTLYAYYSTYIKNFPVKMIRHVIRPTVSLSYRPDFSDITKWNFYDTYNLPSQKDPVVYSLYNGGSGAWSGMYGYPPEGKSGLLTLSLSNNLEMKVRSKKDTVNNEKKIVLIKSVNISSSYNMAKDSLRWSNISLSGRTTLLKKLDVQYGAGMDPYILVYDSARNKTYNINQYEWDVNRRFARMKNDNWRFGLTLQLGPDLFKDNKEESEEDKEDKTDLLQGSESDYYNFNIGWSLNVSYTLNYGSIYHYSTSPKPDSIAKTLVQSMSFTGSINLTPNWKIGVTSGYDFEHKAVTMTSVNISRDLHCWEMSVNWIPFGTFQQYNFRIGVKPGVLQDLKLNRRRSWYDNI